MLLAIQQNKDLINLQHPVGNNASKGEKFLAV